LKNQKIKKLMNNTEVWRKSINIHEKLYKEGFIVIDNYVPNTIFQDLKQQIRDAFLSEDVIRVNNDGIVISTINGNELLSQSSLTSQIYKSTLDLLSNSFSKVFELDDNKIAISANRLSTANDQFRLHFDRNQLTVIVYLTSNYNFPLILYPLVRKDPRIFKNEMNKKININSSKQIKIYPEPRRSIIFWGRKTLHGVIFEKTDRKCVDDRLSLQFGFDLDKFNYDEEYYYGKKSC
jgi:hypothetical protein